MEEIKINLEKITNYILNNPLKLTEKIDLNNGQLGIFLFLLSYNKFLPSKVNLQKIQEIFEHISNTISFASHSSLSHKNLIDYSKVLNLLENEKLLDFQSQSLFNELNNLLDISLRHFLNHKDYDMMGGALNIGNYFISRCKIDDNDKRIKMILESLNINYLGNRDSGIYWKSNLYDGKRVYLGLHGSAGIINFIITTLENNFHKEMAEGLLVPSIKFILSNKLINSKNCYPIYIGNSIPHYSLEFVYSDLYIGYTLFRAGKYLNDKKIMMEGISIFENSFEFSEKGNIGTTVRDSGIAYGIEGTYIIYNVMERLLDDDRISKMKAKCIEFSKSHFVPDAKIKHLGYKPNIIVDEPGSRLGFITGISGIGCVYISHIDQKINLYEKFLNF